MVKALFLLAALVLLSPFLLSTPAGPALCAVALAAQAQPRPALARVALVTMSDRAFLAYLLAREVR